MPCALFRIIINSTRGIGRVRAYLSNDGTVSSVATFLDVEGNGVERT